MNRASLVRMAAAGLVLLITATVGLADDWPQWRGANRDGRATGFKAPQTWPKELTKKWSETVGDGVATPALVGDKLYVFARESGKEVISCLDASTGKKLWQQGYEAAGASGPASGFAGPRSSPTVEQGKVITLGVQGALCCWDAATGKQLWRKDDYKGSVPSFFTSSSPIVIDGLCIAQLGGGRNGGGGIIAYALATGEEQWKWTGDGAAYGSPSLMTINGTKVIIAPTSGKMVALETDSGKVLWEVMYAQGRYNAATPIVSGQTLIYAGPNRGITAEKLEKQGNELVAKELWRNEENSVIYNTPVLKDGLLYGISTQGGVFCINAETGKTAWTSPDSQPEAGARPDARPESKSEARPEAKSDGKSDSKSDAKSDGKSQNRPDDKKGPPRFGFGKGKSRGGRGGGAGYGSIVDAGPVLFALTPTGELVVLEPSEKEFKKLASFKVAEGSTYAHPVVAGNRIYIKDREALTLWTIE